MKNKAVVSERGTITIPEPIRRIAHIHAGDLIEFKPQRHRIILRHLIIREVDDETFMSTNEWDKLDKLTCKQLKNGGYKHYTDLDKAKAHSLKLTRKK